MERWIGHLVCVCASLSLAPLQGSAQVVSSSVDGRLASASATIPVRETSTPLMEVPDDQQLILTQACTSWTLRGDTVILPRPVVPAPRIVASGLGMIPMSSGGFGLSVPGAARIRPISTCTVFDPGLALEPGTSMTCETTAPADSGTTCLVTGVLIPQRRRER